MNTSISISTPINVPFRGNNLYLVEHQGNPYVPMKPVVEGMGLVWAAQFVKLKSKFSKGISEIEIPSAGGNQVMTCLPLRKLPAWLYSVQPGKVSPVIREKVVAYQEECDEVLWQYWTKGKVDRQSVAEEQRKLPSTYIEALENLIASEKEKEQIQLQRDEAIRTKACISSSREASVMAKLGHTKREVEALKEQLGVGTKHKSVKGAGLDQFYIDESGNRRQTANRLKKIAQEMGLAGDIIDIEDPNYGTVKAYPVSVIERFKLEVAA
ncbi:phage antirepressor N-terminal domain-containing protein [Aeromonas veronii]